MQHAFIISQFSPYIIGQKITYSVYFAVKKQNKTKHKTKQNAFSTNRKFFWVQIWKKKIWKIVWKFLCVCENLVFLKFFFFVMFLLESERNRFSKELCLVFISNDLYLFVQCYWSNIIIANSHFPTYSVFIKSMQHIVLKVCSKFLMFIKSMQHTFYSWDA